MAVATVLDLCLRREDGDVQGYVVQVKLAAGNGMCRNRSEFAGVEQKPGGLRLLCGQTAAG